MRPGVIIVNAGNSKLIMIDINNDKKTLLHTFTNKEEIRGITPINNHYND